MKKDLYLIMEFAGGGELYDHVAEQKGLDELQTRDIIRQVCYAMQTCHN